ncbi:hypothetical protein WN48_01820 [Eufriesea mexicana]|uniref:Uncharacterized protein n=1 Tax=Eufriesea mexicana TaxID=516756 RepID=A0A310SQZ7_9HYME|nr:hypothetical protein WN48_01820 [Eufriesea mexicana]
MHSRADLKLSTLGPSKCRNSRVYPLSGIPRKTVPRVRPGCRGAPVAPCQAERTRARGPSLISGFSGSWLLDELDQAHVTRDITEASVHTGTGIHLGQAAGEGTTNPSRVRVPSSGSARGLRACLLRTVAHKSRVSPCINQREAEQKLLKSGWNPALSGERSAESRQRAESGRKLVLGLAWGRLRGNGVVELEGVARTNGHESETDLECRTRTAVPVGDQNQLGQVPSSA